LGKRTNKRELSWESKGSGKDSRRRKKRGEREEEGKEKK
jgi:hypothetical protein